MTTDPTRNGRVPPEIASEPEPDAADIRLGMAETKAGHVISHEDAMAEIYAVIAAANAGGTGSA